MFDPAVFERLAEVRRTSELADIYTCRQGEPLGLGHAVGMAASHVGDNAFAVLLGLAAVVAGAMLYRAHLRGDFNSSASENSVL